jgi:hypothetical protein
MQHCFIRWVLTSYFCFSVIVFVLLLTFVEYVAVILSGVVSALLGSVFLNDVLRTCCYLVFVSCIALNFGLCV